MSNGERKQHALVDILTINGYGLDMFASANGELGVQFNLSQLGKFIQSITRGMLEYCIDDIDALKSIDDALEASMTYNTLDGVKIVVNFPGVKFDPDQDESDADEDPVHDAEHTGEASMERSADRTEDEMRASGFTEDELKDHFGSDYHGPL